MLRSAIFDRLVEIIREQTGNEATETSTTRDLAYDSLMLVELMIACEDEWPGLSAGPEDTELFSGPVGKLADEIARRLS